MHVSVIEHLGSSAPDAWAVEAFELAAGVGSAAAEDEAVCPQPEKVARLFHQVVRLGKEVQRVDHDDLGFVENAQLLEQVRDDNPRRAC